MISKCCSKLCTAGYGLSLQQNEIYIKHYLFQWDLVCGHSSLAEVSQTLVMAGQAFGAMIFTSLSDKYGRKPSHIFSHIGLMLVALATAFSPNYTSFAIFRFLTGALQQVSIKVNIFVLFDYSINVT